MNYDKEWNEVVANGSGRATYTGLQPGEYKFVAYTANGDKIWGKTPAEITIVIAPPFWATAWAIAVYAMLATGLMFWLWKSSGGGRSSNQDGPRSQRTETARRTRPDEVPLLHEHQP